jgi:hypothetical protein
MAGRAAAGELGKIVLQEPSLHQPNAALNAFDRARSINPPRDAFQLLGSITFIAFARMQRG